MLSFTNTFLFLVCFSCCILFFIFYYVVYLLVSQVFICPYFDIVVDEGN